VFQTYVNHRFGYRRFCYTQSTLKRKKTMQNYHWIKKVYN